MIQISCRTKGIEITQTQNPAQSQQLCSCDKRQRRDASLLVHRQGMKS